MNPNYHHLYVVVLNGQGVIRCSCGQTLRTLAHAIGLGELREIEHEHLTALVGAP